MSILVETSEWGMDYVQSVVPSNPVKYMTWLDTTDPLDCKHKIYNGSYWMNLDSDVVAASGDVGIFGGGTTGSYVNTIEQVTISSAGNATDFGDLTEGKSGLTATSNA